MNSFDDYQMDSKLRELIYLYISILYVLLQWTDSILNIFTQNTLLSVPLV